MADVTKHKDPIDFVQFLRDASAATWNWYPVCPVMSRKGDWQEGVVAYDVATRPIVYLDANVVLMALTQSGNTWKQALAPYAKKEYPSLEALVDEWRVD